MNGLRIVTGRYRWSDVNLALQVSESRSEGISTSERLARRISFDVEEKCLDGDVGRGQPDHLARLQMNVASETLDSVQQSIATGARRCQHSSVHVHQVR